jgi:hypothetical protein
VSDNLYFNKDIAKTELILRTLEESYHHKERILPKRIDEKTNISIEHIMPVHLTDEWRTHLGRSYDQVQRQWLHTIGNLTLTGYNGEMKNDDFENKKRYLLNSHIQLNSFSGMLINGARLKS